jgi:creatinine amidohydrolase/Fe(II)-dependent formamide hydrolase-like protein
MKKVLSLFAFSAVFAAFAFGQAARLNVKDIVELELLTSSEVAEKIKGGMTTVLVPVGGTEIRGPQNILGVHTILANKRAVGAAKRLGNALVAPTLPIAVAATGGPGANAGTQVTTSPGAIQMPADTFKVVMQTQVDCMVYSGFKDIFLMGDHGGGQQQMREIAEEYDKKLAERGIHVYYIADFYQKTHDDIDLYNYNHKLPIAGHGGVMETAEMMYWEPYQYAYVRENYKTAPLPAVVPNSDPEAWKRQRDARDAARAAGPAAEGGQRGGGGGGGRGGRGGGGAAGGDAAAGGGAAGGRGGRGGNATADSNAPRVELYGLSANPHPSTKAIGKDFAEIGIGNTVAEIKKQMAEKRGNSQK